MVAGWLPHVAPPVKKQQVPTPAVASLVSAGDPRPIDEAAAVTATTTTTVAADPIIVRAARGELTTRERWPFAQRLRQLVEVLTTAQSSAAARVY